MFEVLRPASCDSRRTPNSDRFDPRSSEQVYHTHAEVIRQPGQAMDGQVLATRLEPRQIPRADAQPFRKGLARPPAPFAQLCEPKTNVAEQIVGVLFLHPKDGAPVTLAKR